MRSKGKSILMLIGCIAVPLLVGGLSSLLAGDIRGIYEGMVKAPFSPPGWLFGIVWPVLYVLMGLAIFMVLRSPVRNKTLPVALFCAQLILNFFWSIVFFGADSLWFAFAIIIALDILVAVCIFTFSRYSKAASWLMAPYLLWILFATYLNVSFAMLN